MTTVITRTRPRAGTRVHTHAQHPSPSTPVSAAGSHCTQTEAKQCIKRIRSRLERWELPHLRELAARLATELEDMTARAEAAERRQHNAEITADMWYHTAQDLIQEAPEGTSVGITQEGQMLVMREVAA